MLGELVSQAVLAIVAVVLVLLVVVFAVPVLPVLDGGGIDSVNSWESLVRNQKLPAATAVRKMAAAITAQTGNFF